MKKYILIGIAILTIVELALFILVGKYIGTLATILACLCTSVIGILLLKKQGMKILNDIKWQVSQGHAPTDALLEGVCVVLGGVLLLVPGYMTDLIGLICILPFTRGYVRNTIKGYIQHRVLPYRR